MADKITTQTMTALIARWQMAYQEKELKQKIRDAAAAKVLELNEITTHCRAACKALGYDRDDPEKWAEALREFGPAARQLYNETKPDDVPEWAAPVPLPARNDFDDDDFEDYVDPQTELSLDDG